MMGISFWKAGALLLLASSSASVGVFAASDTCTPQGSQQVCVNGDFEIDDSTWTWAGDATLTETYSTEAAESGDYFAYLSASTSWESILESSADATTSTVSQTLTGLVVGETYDFTAYYNLQYMDKDNCLFSSIATCTFSVTADSTVIDSETFTTSSTTGSYQEISASYTATTTSAVLEFVLSCTGSGLFKCAEAGLLLDNISLLSTGETCSATSSTATPTATSSVAPISASASLVTPTATSSVDSTSLLGSSSAVSSAAASSAAVSSSAASSSTISSSAISSSAISSSAISSSAISSSAISSSAVSSSVVSSSTVSSSAVSSSAISSSAVSSSSTNSTRPSSSAPTATTAQQTFGNSSSSASYLPTSSASSQALSSGIKASASALLSSSFSLATPSSVSNQISPISSSSASKQISPISSSSAHTSSPSLLGSSSLVVSVPLASTELVVAAISTTYVTVSVCNSVTTSSAESTAIISSPSIVVSSLSSHVASSVVSTAVRSSALSAYTPVIGGVTASTQPASVTYATTQTTSASLHIATGAATKMTGSLCAASFMILAAFVI